MGRSIGLALALGLIALCPFSAEAQAPAGKPGLARELIEGCLKPPSPETVAQLAAAVGAKPYSDVRRKRELKTSTDTFQEPATGQDQRTTTTVVEFLGWDLPGPGAGSLEFRAERTETDWVDRASRQSTTPVRVAMDQSCKLDAPVANARAVFELYEGLTDREYGIRISADRRWVDVFMFDEDNFDIELSFVLDTPVPGLPPETAQSDDRLVMPDGGPRFINSAAEGVAAVRMTRAQLLAALDQPADMSFFNMKIEPVVQRLAAAKDRRPTALTPPRAP
jgi:hypothetical protein